MRSSHKNRFGGNRDITSGALYYNRTSVLTPPDNHVTTSVDWISASTDAAREDKQHFFHWTNTADRRTQRLLRLSQSNRLPRMSRSSSAHWCRSPPQVSCRNDRSWCHALRRWRSLRLLREEVGGCIVAHGSCRLWECRRKASTPPLFFAFQLKEQCDDVYSV